MSKAATSSGEQSSESLLTIRDSETYSHKWLMRLLGFKTERAVKDWISENDVPYLPVKGLWLVDGASLRQQIRLRATTHKQRQAE